jgi:hypothetical protein
MSTEAKLMSRSQSAPTLSARQLQIFVVAVCLFLPFSLLPSAASPQTTEIAKPPVASNVTAARVPSDIHKAIAPLTIPLALTNNLVIVELSITAPGF